MKISITQQYTIGVFRFESCSTTDAQTNLVLLGSAHDKNAGIIDLQVPSSTCLVTRRLPQPHIGPLVEPKITECGEMASGAYTHLV